MEDIMMSAFEYTMILSVPITLFTVVALSDAIILMVKEAVIPSIRRKNIYR